MSLLTSLISYWKLDEENGVRNDAHGSNNLTDNNTVLFGTGKIENAADFESDNTEYLSHVDNAGLSVGDIDFTFAAWVNLESLSDRAIITKTATVGNTDTEYAIYYSNSSSRFRFQVSNGAGTGVTLVGTSSGAISTSTWYYVIAWHDAAANEVYIQVNNGTVDSASYSAGSFDGSNSFNISSYNNGTGWLFDGLIDEVGFWKRILTSQERSNLYNSGNGLAYPFSVAFIPRVSQF